MHDGLVGHYFPLRAIPGNFGLIWFSAFSGEDLNVLFLNLHNRYKSAERKMSQKTLE
jgi:hypothetical protein